MQLDVAIKTGSLLRHFVFGPEGGLYSWILLFLILNVCSL